MILTMFVACNPISSVILDEMEVSSLDEITRKDVRNSRLYDPMLNETRVLLDEFFQPFNKDLANLLNDDTFLWN